jgi:DNA-binding response OmpR family regulator
MGNCAPLWRLSTLARKAIIAPRAFTVKPIARMPKILIIDDDRLHLKIYTWILQRQSYECKTALVGSASVELPSDDVIDLVLLDYRLSSTLNALDVIRQIRNTFTTTPIVILSEMEWMPDDVRGHVSAFVYKGDPNQLLQTIATVLQSKSLPSE